MIGNVLQNRYEVEKKIGQGGAAAIYLGFDTKLRRSVAIKVLECAEGDNDIVAHLGEEAQAMARLNHPNIVAVYDVAEHDGRPYFVMEFVEGRTLMELAERSKLSLPLVCSVARQVCRGMSYAHSQGVIHGDLTLKNVIVNEGDDEDQRVKILDFGLSRLQHHRTRISSGTMLGTPYYLAPEQIRQESADHRTDVYAFGVGLYRLVNGRYPFQAQHPAALLYVILNQRRFQREEGVPERLHDLILRCLEKHPGNRPGSFDDLAAELADIETEMGERKTPTPQSHSGVTYHDKENPYLNRVMIKDPLEFIGREAEVRRIYSRLDAVRPQSVSVVGERKIGKSSLLNFIYHPANRAAFMRNHQNCIVVYLDFQSRLEYDIEMFIDFLFNMFTFECRENHDYRERKKTLDELGKVVAELDDEGKRIVILMDEFEVITRNERFDESFFAFLRSLANSHKVAYVTSSCEDLQEMCHNKAIADSPFFNIFSNLPLRAFERPEAERLIRVPSERAGVPMERHAGQIMNLAGCFPLYLQVACSIVFDYLVDDESMDPDWDQISQLFGEEIAPYYRSVWSRFDDASRENVATIAMGHSSSRRYVNKRLLRRGYLVESNNELRLFASSFRDFVIAETERTSTKRGLWRRIFGARLGGRG